MTGTLDASTTGTEVLRVAGLTKDFGAATGVAVCAAAGDASTTSIADRAEPAKSRPVKVVMGKMPLFEDAVGVKRPASVDADYLPRPLLG